MKRNSLAPLRAARRPARLPLPWEAQADTCASARPSLMMCAALVLLCSACPQLLDDRFRAQSGLQSGDAGDAFNGSNTSRTPDAPMPSLPPPNQPSALAPGEPDGSAAAPFADASAGAVAQLDAGAEAFSDEDAGAVPVRTCRSGSHTTASGACYALFETRLNWGAARAQCHAQGRGWELASIPSDQDSELLAALIPSEMWVGASDQTLEGTWLWVDDGTVFFRGSGTSGSAADGQFANWNSNEPNGNDPSDCMRILPGGRWADFQCANTLGYICMGPPD